MASQEKAKGLGGGWNGGLDDFHEELSDLWLNP